MGRHARTGVPTNYWAYWTTVECHSFTNQCSTSNVTRACPIAPLVNLPQQSVFSCTFQDDDFYLLIDERLL